MRLYTTDIIAVAARMSGLTIAEIKGPRRFTVLTRTRFAICHVAREQNAPPSYPEIARKLGRGDHTSIINGCRKAADLIKRDAVFAAFVTELRARVIAAGPHVTAVASDAERVTLMDGPISEKASAYFGVPRHLQNAEQRDSQAMADHREAMAQSSAAFLRALREARPSLEAVA